MDRRKAVITVIAAGTLWGGIGLFVNWLAGGGLSSLEISFTRTFSSAVILALLFLFTDRSLFKIDLKDIWMFIGTGVVSLTLFSLCYFTTIINVESSIAVSLLYTSPAFLMVLSALFFREKINSKKIVSIILTVVGCALVSGFAGSGAKMGLKDLMIGIGSGFFYATYSVFARFALKKYRPLTINFYTFLFSSVCFAFVNGKTGLGHIASSGAGVIVIAVVAAFLCCVLPYLLYTTGLKDLDTSVAGVLVAVEPVVGCIIGLTVFRESTDPLKITGIVLILLAIVISSIYMPKKKTADKK